MGQPTTSSKAPEESLTVRDNRTGKVYTIPYVTNYRSLQAQCSIDDTTYRIENNTVPAIAFKEIAAPRKEGEREENETERGLRVADKGFMNTAVITSEITYIDGDAGSKFFAAA